MKENYNYKGWLNSDSPTKRVFGVFLYGFIGKMIILIFLLLIVLFLESLGVS